MEKSCGRTSNRNKSKSNVSQLGLNISANLAEEKRQGFIQDYKAQNTGFDLGSSLKKTILNS